MPRQKKFEELNSTFNIEPIKEDLPVETAAVEIVQSEISALNNDIKYVFGVLNSTIEKSKEALDCALELAQETDSARAYEVVSQLVKQTVDSAEKIIDIHKKLNDMESEKKISTNITNNNAVFVGTTAEALKLLKANLSNTNNK